MKVRCWQMPDGSIHVTRPADPGGFARAMARHVEVNPDYKGLPYVDLDDAALPPYEMPCADCGEAHSVRDRWSLKGRKIVVDESVPHADAAMRHLEHAIEAERGKDRPDMALLERLRSDHRRIAAGRIASRPERTAAFEATRRSHGTTA
jgi:hypothetical protein